MIDNREMALFANSLWDNYIKFRHKEANLDTVSFYKAEITAKPGNGKFSIQRPFDTDSIDVAYPSYMEDAPIGTQVLVLKFGEGNNLANHFIIDNAARTMLASAIATGSSVTFPISIQNGGTGATSLAGAKTNLGVPSASDTNPAMDGTASAGALNTYSRGDHVHPSDNTKADKATTVTNVAYDSTNQKLTQTINGIVSDIISLATSSGAGLMSAADKAKLDSVANGATKVEGSSQNGYIKINGVDTKVCDGGGGGGGSTATHIYSNPALTSVNGECVWTISHPAEDIVSYPNVNIYNQLTGQEVNADVRIVDDDEITVTFVSDTNIPASTYIAVFTSQVTATYGSKTVIYNNPALTASSGICTWTITHDTSLVSGYLNVNIYNSTTGQLVVADVTVTAANTMTVEFISSTNIAANTYVAVVTG